MLKIQIPIVDVHWHWYPVKFFLSLRKVVSPVLISFAAADGQGQQTQERLSTITKDESKENIATTKSVYTCIQISSEELSEVKDQVDPVWKSKCMELRIKFSNWDPPNNF